MINKLLFSISTLGLAILLPAAFASPLSNNTASTDVDINASGFTGTQVADTGALPFATSRNVNGTLDQQVYRESGGTLDFYYLITNNASSIDNIGRMTTIDFTGFTTAVSYLIITNGIPPSGADRSPSGDTVGFDFKDRSGNNTLAPGASSDWLEIATNANAFTTGQTFVIDGGTGSVQTYAPTATPEPMSMSLLGVGLAGSALLGLRRRYASNSSLS